MPMTLAGEVTRKENQQQVDLFSQANMRTYHLYNSAKLD
jgi:hypothetical protein